MVDTKASKREALRAQQAAAARAARNRRMLGVGLGIVAVILVAVFVIIAVNQAGQSTAQLVPPHAVVNKYGVEVGSNPGSTKDGIAISPEKTKAGAPVVELFADYQCPGCKQFDETYGAKLNELAASGDISYQVQILTFLDRFGAGKSTNPAIAAACSDISGVFPAYHLAIYHGQPAKEGDGYTEDQLRNQFPTAAGLAGDKLTAFQKCYDGKQTSGFVNDENKFNSAYTTYWYTKLGGQGNAEAEAWGSTPLLTVNGKMLATSSLPADPNGLLAAIKQAAG